MGLFLIFAGLFFAWRMWLSYEKAQITRAWTQVPCRIISSGVVSQKPTPNSPLVYRAEVRYEYTFEGVRHQGANIRPVEPAPTAHLEDVQRRQQSYPAGSEHPCYVNPASPAEAVLEHGTRAALYSIWFPLLFVAGGVGMLHGTLRQRRRRHPTKPL